MQIPLVDLKTQFAHLEPELAPVLKSVFDQTSFIMGEPVDAFESAFARYCGVRHAIGASSGTAALLLAYQAMGFKAGDEVIVPSHTFIATVSPLYHLGVKPVFVDIHSDTYNLNVELVEKLITPKTRAIVPVHLYGQAADMDALARLAEKHGLSLVEDCAQAHGSKWNGRPVGDWSRAACFSFYPGKNLGAAGDAGAVITNDDDLNELLRLLVNHGSQTKYLHTHLGLNSRLDALQAAVLKVKLNHIERWTKLRREHAAVYNRLLAKFPDVVLPREAPAAHHVYHLYVIRVPGNRDAILKELHRRGVGAGVHYPIPLHLQPVFSELGYRKGDLPETEASAESIISLPMYPELDLEKLEYVAQTLHEVLNVFA